MTEGFESITLSKKLRIWCTKISYAASDVLCILFKLERKWHDFYTGMQMKTAHYRDLVVEMLDVFQVRPVQATITRMLHHSKSRMKQNGKETFNYGTYVPELSCHDHHTTVSPATNDFCSKV
jgi:hypothetical protein